MKRILILLALAAPASAQQSLTSAQVGRIDSLFARYASLEGPGCALGVSRHDTVVFEKGWGSADIEHGIPITPSTIFEAGSVSKQFTAAAVLRLAQQGKLSLDSSVRKYVPEMPEYAAPITLRHLLHHTSGLRDWGAVMAFAGWPRGTRTYTHAHVLEIITRQTALNHAVGAEYIYSNSNYNLLAIVAERVSGKSLPEFTRTELFEPLGMSNTGWRDDYSRIVKGRAQAYSGSGAELRLTMPFENVYGNSSLLTTVGDLLKWSANTSSKRVGGDEFVKLQHTRGVLTNGRVITYAAGIAMDTMAGTPEYSHDGATAGYRAFLGRYPEKGYAVALLCNHAGVPPGTAARAVARILMPELEAAPQRQADPAAVAVSADRLARLAGHYRMSRNDDPFNLIIEHGTLRIARGPLLRAISQDNFAVPGGRVTYEFDDRAGGTRPRLRGWTTDGDTVTYDAVNAPRPSSSYGEYAGQYYSAEADARISFVIENNNVVLYQAPNTKFALMPLYEDGFAGRGTVIRFVRTNGKVTGFLVTGARARGVRFERSNQASELSGDGARGRARE